MKANISALKVQELTDKLSALKEKLSPAKEWIRIKSVKGDEIDKLLADHLNKNKIEGFALKRTEKGKYELGVKKITAKILNDKLILKVGVKSMGADDFIM